MIIRLLLCSMFNFITAVCKLDVSNKILIDLVAAAAKSVKLKINIQNS